MNKEWSNRNEGAKDFLVDLFTRVLPSRGMYFRKEQMEVSLCMLEALQKNKIALCEAEVGTGKTHAYLLAVISYHLYGEKKSSTIISTSTIALQNAMIKEYLPWISRILRQEKIVDKPLTYVFRKGKSHYICDKRLYAYIGSLVKNEKEMLLVNILEDLKCGTENIDLDKIPISSYIKKRICVDTCEKSCGFGIYCRYQEFLDKCKGNQYDFQIVNHNYLIADLMQRSQNKNGLLSPYRAIVIDEAHKLHHILQDMYGKKFSSVRIPRILMRLENLTTIPLELCEPILRENEALFSYLIKESNGRKWIAQQQVRGLITNIIDEIHILEDNKILQKQREYRQRNSVIFQLEQTLEILHFFRSGTDKIFWVEKGNYDEYLLMGLPTNLQVQLQDDIWSVNLPIIMTSGTISVQGDFHYMEQKLGLHQKNNQMLQITKKSPFQYEQQGLLYFPKHMPFPIVKNSKYIEAVIAEILSLIAITKGHTVVLFTSYQMMERVYLAIQEVGIPYPIFAMQRGKYHVLESFKTSKNGVLFASDTAGEGIDLAGDVLSSLIVVKLPFPIPTAISEYESSKRGQFCEYVEEEIVPYMLIKLRQWIGRGIRCETDTCVFSILDCRAWRKYYDDIITALPPIPVTRSKVDIAEFLQENKSIDYFQ